MSAVSRRTVIDADAVVPPSRRLADLLRSGRPHSRQAVEVASCRVVSLDTPRLRLRPWQAEDLDDYLRIFSKAPAMAFQMDRGLTPEEARGFLQFHIDTWHSHPFGHWAVVTKTDSRPIGWVGLESTNTFPEAPEGLQIGWRLDPDRWGHGYATEAALAVLTYAFAELALSNVYVLFHPENQRSARVAAKLGAIPLSSLGAADGSEFRRVFVVYRDDFLGR